MRILLQRVSRARVVVGGETIGRIERGALLLVGFGREDETPPLARMADKIANLRIFADDGDGGGGGGRPERSLLDVGGGVLAVPQFTLHGRTAKGRRPDFTHALAPALAESHFHSFVDFLSQAGVAQVECGRFGAQMAVESVNDGPFTLMLDG